MNDCNLDRKPLSAFCILHSDGRKALVLRLKILNFVFKEMPLDHQTLVCVSSAGYHTLYLFLQTLELRSHDIIADLLSQWSLSNTLSHLHL